MGIYGQRVNCNWPAFALFIPRQLSASCARKLSDFLPNQYDVALRREEMQRALIENVHHERKRQLFKRKKSSGAFMKCREKSGTEGKQGGGPPRALVSFFERFLIISSRDEQPDIPRHTEAARTQIRATSVQLIPSSPWVDSLLQFSIVSAPPASCV